MQKGGGTGRNSGAGGYRLKRALIAGRQGPPPQTVPVAISDPDGRGALKFAHREALPSVAPDQGAFQIVLFSSSSMNAFGFTPTTARTAAVRPLVSPRLILDTVSFAARTMRNRVFASYM